MKRQTLETAIRSILESYPPGTLFDCIAHSLQNDGEAWSTNDSWKMGRACDIPETLTHCRARWEVWKVNYHPRARVRNLTDANWSGPDYSALLEVDCIPFMELLPVKD